MLLIKHCNIDHLAVSDPAQCGYHVPDVDTAGAAELAQGELHEVEGAADKQEDDDVGDQEGSSAILVGSKGEPPDVAKTWTEKELSNFNRVVKLRVNVVHCAVLSLVRGYCEALNFSPS